MAALIRWLHIYLSMISFAIVFFFSVTGLTLNHADKFTSQVKTVQEKGKLDSSWVNITDTAKINKLQVVEYLRAKNNIKAACTDFIIDDVQLSVSFKGPGYAADVFIERSSGTYELTKTMAGFVGVVNDLHKGRDTGSVWSVVIDVSAVLMTIVSLTGFLLLLYIKRKKLSGLLVALAGLLIAYLMYALWVK